MHRVEPILQKLMGGMATQGMGNALLSIPPKTCLMQELGTAGIPPAVLNWLRNSFLFIRVAPPHWFL